MEPWKLGLRTYLAQHYYGGMRALIGILTPLMGVDAMGIMMGIANPEEMCNCVDRGEFSVPIPLAVSVPLHPSREQGGAPDALRTLAAHSIRHVCLPHARTAFN